MLDVNLERLRAHQKNIDRYRRLLATHLSDLERSYIQRRLSEEQASYAREVSRDSARLPRIEGRTTTLEMAALLHPANAFEHPLDVIDDCDLTSYEKRAILSSWAADACAAPQPSRPVRDSTAVSFDDIIDALHLLEPEPEPAGHRNRSGQHSGAQSSGHSYS